MKINFDGLIHIPKNRVPNINILKKMLTVRSRFDNEYSVTAFKESQDTIGIPLNCGILNNISANALDCRVLGSKIAIKLQKSPYPYQAKTIAEIIRCIENGNTNFIIKARTGWGKTLLIAALASYIGATALVIVPTTALVNQWVRSLKDLTDLTDDDIGVASDAKVNWEGKKIVVGLVHTLALDRWGDDFKRNFGVVFYDEVDKSAPPETFAPVCTMFVAKYRIAVSATVDRPDGLSQIFKWHFGEKFINGNKYNDIKVMPSTVLVVNFAGAYREMPRYLANISNKNQRRGIIISGLAECAKRNEMLGYYINKLLVTNRQTLVLTDRVAQMVYLANYMRDRYNVNVRDIGLFASSIPKSSGYKKEKQECLREKTVIFATYKMLDVGFDLDTLAGLVLATPRSNIEQTVGRIERFLEGKQQPVVVDPVDVDVVDAMRWYMGRERTYSKICVGITKRRHA